MIECPQCGEQRRLRGQRDDEGVTHITCEQCGASWNRDQFTCPECGEPAMYSDKRPLYQKARGVQQSIIGYNTVMRCGACGYSDAVSDGGISYTSDDK